MIYLDKRMRMSDVDGIGFDVFSDQLDLIDGDACRRLL
jgi:hypothetical protein